MKRHRLTVEAKKAWLGRSFLIPFYIGVLVFFIKPLIQSFMYAFQEIEVVLGGYSTKFVGLENYKYIFTKDTAFNENLLNSMTQLLYRIPVILLTSLLLAMVIKRNFKGRTFVRAVFFLPVVLSSGVLAGRLTKDVVVSNILMGSQDVVGNTVGTVSVQNILLDAGLSSAVVGYFNTISASLFSYMWLSGVQIVIFLAGLQKISPALYESSSIEGATAWDDFWKITLPMLKPMILFVLIFTIVETFSERTNTVMIQILNAISYMRISQAAAMAWVFSLLILIVVGIIFFLFNRKDTTYDI